MASKLHLVDSETGDVYGVLTRTEASELSTDLMYTIDYRYDEHPDCWDLKVILDRWLTHG